MQKIQGTCFKISALYFKIYALYFSSFQITEKQTLTKRPEKPLFFASHAFKQYGELFFFVPFFFALRTSDDNETNLLTLQIIKQKLYKKNLRMKILITGASGFIGSFLVERALSAGMEVWAGVRKTSSRQYLTDPRIHFIDIDYCNEQTMRSTFERAKQDFGAWDVIIHAAGITKSRFKNMFFRVNYDGTRRMVSALRDSDTVPAQFIYISSLSVLGAIRENATTPHPAPNPFGADGSAGELRNVVYEPMKSGDMPVPNTAYGLSKAAAENYLHTIKDFPWVIFRPTGVYGPREKDYFLMAKSIKNHVDFSVGFKPQEITFIYVKDLVNAIFAAITRKVVHKTYLLSDGRTYESRAFSLLLQKEMGVRNVIHIKAPLWVLRSVCAVAEIVSNITNTTPTLNSDKYKIMKQRNWQCDIDEAVRELGYKAEYDLKRGVKETVEWYKENYWI